METLADLFEEQIKDLYSAEKQLTKALPKMMKAAASEELKKAFEDHLAETTEQVARLEKIAELCEFKPTGEVCAAMKGLIEEGQKAMDEEGEDPILDAGLVAAAQRIEHYEMSGYGTAKRLAELLGEDEAVKLLDLTLGEEEAADEKLTEVAEQSLYPAAQSDEEGEEGDDEDEEESEEDESDDDAAEASEDDEEDTGKATGRNARGAAGGGKGAKKK
jgi:ferritin-like metal-binding protein YciE